MANVIIVAHLCPDADIIHAEPPSVYSIPELMATWPPEAPGRFCTGASQLFGSKQAAAGSVASSAQALGKVDARLLHLVSPCEAHHQQGASASRAKAEGSGTDLRVSDAPST